MDIEEEDHSPDSLSEIQLDENEIIDIEDSDSNKQEEQQEEPKTDIKDLFDEDDSNFIEIQRNELAEHFNCVPSQINYVISTRFRPSQGYYVESRRGGRRTYHNKKS